MFLAPHILDWIYSEGFDEVTIPNMVPEAIFNGVTTLESASKSGRINMQEQWESGNYVNSRQSLTLSCN